MRIAVLSVKEGTAIFLYILPEESIDGLVTLWYDVTYNALIVVVIYF